MLLFAREPGDTISTVPLLDPNPFSGSITLYAGWKVADRPYGAPYDGYLPFPVPLLRAVAYDPAVDCSLCQPVAPPPWVH
jgi:hypothetical protein